MPRKKICPKCGCINNPADPECRNCGISITGVKAANYAEDELKTLEEKFSRDDDVPADSQSSEDEASRSSADGDKGVKSSEISGNADISSSLQEKSDAGADEGSFTMKTAVRICPECGAENPRSRRKCSSCGTDIHLVQVQYRDEGLSTGSSASPSSQPSSISSPSESQSVSAVSSPASGTDAGSGAAVDEKLQRRDSKPVEHDVRDVGSRQQVSGVSSATASSSVPVSADDMRMVKICPDCQAEMGEKFKRCTRCGCDLRDVQPVAVEKPKVNIRQQKPRNSDVAVLCSPEGKEILTLRRSSPVIILGREHEMASYLSECQYVSRKHCELKIYEGRVIINDGSSTNGTYVNNRKIQSMKDEQLKGGDQISLGGVWDCDGAGCFTIRYNDE